MTLGHSTIPYLQRLWHPTTGCSGQNCPMKGRGCWAEGLIRDRLAGTMKGLPHGITCVEGGIMVEDDPFRPTFHPDRLTDPLRVREPQIIGVSFFGDWCDARISREYRLQILSTWPSATNCGTLRTP